MTDPISDFFNRIQNAYRAERAATIVPYSRLKEEIAKVLEAKNYIAGYEKKGRKVRKFLEVKLRYDGTMPAMHGVKRLSRPSRRLYAGASDIRPVKQGYGFLVISTSKGLMSGDEARKATLGGELIAEIW